MIERYRTWLYAPLDHPDRCLRALTSDADQVIWDLEDAVDESSKESARETLTSLLGTSLSRTPWVRINGLDTPWGLKDLQSVAAFGSKAPRWVVPKASRKTVQTLQSVGIGGQWLLIIETAEGLLDILNGPVQAWDIPGEVRLAFGSLDYRNDIGAQETSDESELLMPRSLIVLASRRWRWEPPIDAVIPSIHDTEALRDSASRGRSLGFGGKMIIHPRQILPVHQVYEPTAQEIAWAQEVISASQSHGTVQVEGAMVDRPVVARARQILADAQ